MCSEIILYLFQRVEDGLLNLNMANLSLKIIECSGQPSDHNDLVLVDNNCTRRNYSKDTSPPILTDVAGKVYIDRSTVFQHLKKLTRENLMEWMFACINLLKRLNMKTFLNQLVTGEDKWMQYIMISKCTIMAKANPQKCCLYGGIGKA